MLYKALYWSPLAVKDVEAVLEYLEDNESRKAPLKFLTII